MEQRIVNAACSGDVNILHQLLDENPFTLSDHALLNSNHETPLAIATKANQLAFVREILKLKPELAMEMNQEGVRPLDIASAYGNLEIVREILGNSGREICRLPGRDGRTAIHYAAINGRVEIVEELLKVCGDCVKDVTSFGETVLHLGVKFFKFDVLRSILQWIKEKVDLVEMVNWGDKEGNTVLHYAASRKQLETVEMLLEWNNSSGNKLEVNAVNNKNLTAMDIVDILIESPSDLHLREILRCLGAHSPQSITNTNKRNKNPVQKSKNWKDLLEHFQFQWQRDSPSDARNALLVVAALIATVTFEAGINPPNYIFERSYETNVSSSAPNNSTITEIVNEMQRNNSSHPYTSLASITVFLVANSVALSTAVSIIDYLMVGFPFQRELKVSMFAMIFAYGWSMGSTRPTGLVKDVLLAVALGTPLFLRSLPYLLSKIPKRKKEKSSEDV